MTYIGSRNTDSERLTFLMSKFASEPYSINTKCVDVTAALSWLARGGDFDRHVSVVGGSGIFLRAPIRDRHSPAAAVHTLRSLSLPRLRSQKNDLAILNRASTAKWEGRRGNSRPLTTQYNTFSLFLSLPLSPSPSLKGGGVSAAH